MTQLEILKNHISEATEQDLIDTLERAKSVILEKRFPLRDFPLDEEGNTYIENRYLGLQIEIAIELFNKKGAEGETSHTENSTQRVYDGSYVSTTLLNRITPKGEVL